MIPYLFETDHYIVVDKPAGWLAVPGRTANDSRPILGRELEKQLKAPIFPVHRLDADVTGLILYAKTKEFHREANQAFEQHAITKTYQALTDTSEFEVGSRRVWTSKLVRGKKRTFEADHGKFSKTEAIVIAKDQVATDWRMNPVTGRSHQLRFELAKHGLPILGDQLYGSQRTWSQGGIALRSISITFPNEFAQKWQIPTVLETKTLLNPKD